MIEPTTIFLAGPPVELDKQRRIGILECVVKPGSERRQCCLCQAATWLGPEQLLKLKEFPEAQVVCFLCAAQNGMRITFALSNEGNNYLVDRTKVKG